jgi:NADH:ubiquinone oxidoreductase subunit E
MEGKTGSLIMILHKIQETFGYIPREAAEKASRITGIPLARIYGVITFYTSLRHQTGEIQDFRLFGYGLLS